ncbi:aminomethyl-transferring glycine dehydrogenase subunit GcvPA [Bacillus pseudomycoides]|uniref:aminomethyl-transferring glycine dehydrogenase subunit GcvPA n=1 Tax=Bacillus pseudomycoides TaxID=64104 RepID=UPI000BEDABE7|nr:aminomethyl-transferring glycine dehydrogenase subunit GcvPA [Bacillus pseudomycoides]MED4654161.1 aminomethyl-transferring glycine dehydrogenase subunit GcvPA [Bacillus pseudomycoides]PEE03140.1 aminomethyl-transferring glycine dehydrogenase [Bacillus pseudomycoides]PEM78713.1 aminomethyl-transferring glycine dehydrogenase [Bacillus pseudomycoides]PHC83122.1 aminomethyl-transferring glycine dehydrogenase [Bacillus pseudomycoides]
MTKKVHPYIPNMVPEVKEEMLKEIGAESVMELYACIPDELKLKEEMNIPKALTEYELRRHIEGILCKNTSTSEYLNFLGAGCWQHFVPAVCDEVNQRSEFLTAYAGEPYEDHGRFQALFEYQSLVAELVDMDVVNVPTFDWGQAAATAIRMAARITKRTEVLVAQTVSPERMKIIQNYGSPDLEFVFVSYDAENGLLDLEDLKNKISSNVAAIYFENPSYLGFIESQGMEIAEIAKQNDALVVVGVDPISLGVLAPPSHYQADIVCGDLQPLGMHMNYSGGQAGFIATRDEEKLINEYPSRLFGIVPTVKEGEYGFGDVAYDRTSFALREKGKESVGTQTALWGITAGVYLSLLGPNGMYELGQTIMQNSQYAVKQLNKIPGVRGSRLSSPFFKEFLVDFNETGLSVEIINKKLLEKQVFGGKDISKEFPIFGQCALYCVTEVHTKEDLDQLIAALQEIVTN